MVPIENGDDERGIDVRANFSARDAEANEGGAAIGIFGEQEAIDFALEREVHAVISQERNAVRNPVVAQQALGGEQPVMQDFEKSLFANLRRAFEIGGKGADGFFVGFEEESALAAEILEDGALATPSCAERSSMRAA